MFKGTLKRKQKSDTVKKEVEAGDRRGFKLKEIGKKFKKMFSISKVSLRNFSGFL